MVNGNRGFAGDKVLKSETKINTEIIVFHFWAYTVYLGAAAPQMNRTPGGRMGGRGAGQGRKTK